MRQAGGVEAVVDDGEHGQSAQGGRQVQHVQVAAVLQLQALLAVVVAAQHLHAALLAALLRLAAPGAATTQHHVTTSPTARVQRECRISRRARTAN